MTLRYHLSGMGDSDGDPGQMTLRTLEDDAAWAAQLLAAAAGDVPMGFVGMRWGALAAASAARARAAERPPWCSSSRSRTFVGTFARHGAVGR